MLLSHIATHSKNTQNIIQLAYHYNYEEKLSKTLRLVTANQKQCLLLIQTVNQNQVSENDDSFTC